MRSTDGWSLQRRLLGGLLGILLLFACGLYVMLARYAASAADRAYDQLLLASALTVAEAVQIEDGQAVVDLPYAALAILATGRRDRIFYRVASLDGSLVTGYPDLASGFPLAQSSEPSFADTSYRGAAIRVVTLGRFVATSGSSGWLTIVIAQTREERTELAAEILANAFAPVVLIAIAAMALLGFGVRRALAPLAVIEEHLRARGPTDLSPVELPVPMEVRQLLAALNQLMRRLQANLKLMQDFLADAAHQIRTPLATLRAQADLAAEEDDTSILRSYVHKIHRNAALASQVTNQLLSHAMITHRSQLGGREEIDLAQLLRQVAYRAEMGGNCPPIELDLRQLGHAPAIVGDAFMLREAFTNLLDNARKYAGDQQPVQIRIASRSDGGRLQVDIADRGPGIPDLDKDRVVERFTRGSGGHAVAGSGLGLAIVKAVAEAHGASLALLDRPGGGLLVRLEFPAAARPSPPAAARAAAWLMPWMLAAATPLFGSTASAAEQALCPAATAQQECLLIHAATDRSAMEPLLQDFQATHPDVTIVYRDLGTNELFLSVVQPPGGETPDLVISSAMDLQAKLVNDGWTQPHASNATARVPAWANWRNEAFGFTLEPAVIVYRRGDLAEAEIPRSRSALIGLLQGQADRLRHRVATYDIAASGVGHLFAAQDSVLSGQFWRLALALGDVHARLYATSAEILDAIERGEVLVGYNVLGSYAHARSRAGAPIGIVLPQDYTLVLSRVAAIPRAARRPELAKLFVDYLLSDRGQAVVAGPSDLHAILPAGDDPPGAVPPLEEAQGPIHPITLGPSLLVFLDPMRKKRFLSSWSASLHRP